MRLKKYKDWLNENGNAQMGITSIDNPGGFIYNPLGEEEDESSNYMFFSNLRRIKELSSMISKMDSAKIDELLNNGHDWANTHVNTAKTNLDHVFEFFKSELNENENSLSESAVKTIDLNRQYSMSTTWWAAWRLETEKDNDYKITKDAFSKTFEVQKGDKIIFVYDYKRNIIFTNEPPSVFVLKDEIDSEKMNKINNKADDIKDDLAGVDKDKVAKAEGEEETDKTEEE